MTRGEPSTRGFEALMEEIDGIVGALERRELELDDALALFETGVARLREAGLLLERARGRVEELIESAAGELSIAGFEADAGEDGATAEGS
ncbi:MAG: exodeoxyribonuclease VII small subunit [Gemmatimonadota bacterium]|jgi:exodeoxyribonuclease VII small subunit